MHVSTKTLTSLLLAATATVMSETSRKSQGWRKLSRFERMLRRHDRKGELRAEILGTSPQEFKSLQKHISFEEVVRRHGILNERTFHLALLGKIKAELHQRGWSRQRIDSYVLSRSNRAS